MTERLRIPGSRDVRATLDGGDAETIVVACPPHPEMGGDRSDSRLRSVSDALAERDIDCLRFDYGEWDKGRGERTDAISAFHWGRERYEAVALFGYSFGGAVALLAAASDNADPAAVSVLAPGTGITGQRNPVDALDAIDCPLQVVYGERDDTADWQPIVDRARATGRSVTAFKADHFFVGQQPRVADAVASFLATKLE